MKHFLLGLGTFIIYALICLYGLHYFTVNNTNTSFFNTSNTNSEPTIVNASALKDPISLEEYIPAPDVDTLITDSIYDNDAVIVDSILRIDTIAINIKSKDVATAIKDDATIIDSIQQQENELPDEIKNLKKHRVERFGIYDDLGNKLVSCKSFAVIYRDQAKVKIPNNCRRYGLVLKDMLDNDARSSVLVTSYYGATEARDIGNARATYVKRLLNNAGISSQRILSTVIQEDINFKENNIAYGGVRFVVAPTYSLKKKIESSQESLRIEHEKDLSLKKFDKSFEDNVFNISNAFTSHIKQIKNYLETNPDKTINIQSFLQDSNNNDQLVKQVNENAELAKTSMLVLGIPEDRIKILTDKESLETELNVNCILLTIK